MIQQIEIEGKLYKVTDEESISTTEELIFEIKNNSLPTEYVVGMFDDLLGYPIQKVWKIIDK